MPITIDESWYTRTDNLPERISAGGAVVRIERGNVFVALVHEKGCTGYVLPKGGLEADESLEAGALREIEEEAGFTDLQLLCDLGRCERLDFQKVAWKITHYFLFRTEQIDVQPTEAHRHDPPSWFELDHLPDMVWPEQRDLILTNRDQIRRHLLG